MSASNYLENELLDHVLRNEAYTAPSTVYCALFTADDSGGATAENLEAGTLTNEVSDSGTAYARQAITFGSVASGGSISNTATITFPTATADYGQVEYVAITDNATAGAGNVLYYGALTAAKTISNGDQFVINTGSLTVTLA